MSFGDPMNVSIARYAHRLQGAVFTRQMNDDEGPMPRFAGRLHSEADVCPPSIRSAQVKSQIMVLRDSTQTYAGHRSTKVKRFLEAENEGQEARNAHVYILK